MLVRPLSYYSYKLIDNHSTVVSFPLKLVSPLHYQRRSVNIVLLKKNMHIIKLSDYDCIGFDLDNTLLKYNITNLVKLQYDLLSDFLVEKKNYNPKYLKKPLTDDDFDFIQKGLILDTERGNILKLDESGMIWRGTHGTKLLTIEELQSAYPDRRWNVADKFIQDMISTWNGELSIKIRALLDYFDMPVSLIFAKIVDTLDEERNESSVYNIYPDILDGMVHIFSKNQFQNDGVFFSALKKNPEKYFHVCSSEIISWIRELKNRKRTFMITGSDFDFIDFTASYALGEDWRSLFDIVICFAKKPGFFNLQRPFFSFEGYEERQTVTAKELEEEGIYSQGNWKDLMEFFTRITEKKNPLCLYFGDNLVQDLYAPKVHANCDIIVVAEEQLAEKILDHELSHYDESMINSKFWGSYFSLKGSDAIKNSYWNYIIKTYAKVCIPSIDIFAKVPLNRPIKCFHCGDTKLSGYYPAAPLSLHF